jgi:hypothetical protein
VESVTDIVSRTGELSADGKMLLWDGYVSDEDKGRRDRYGLKQDQFNLILLEQNGRCYRCGRLFNKSTPCVDHDHDTREIYGLLHNGCNKKRKQPPADPPARRVGPFFVPESRMAAMEHARTQRNTRRSTKAATARQEEADRQARREATRVRTKAKMQAQHVYWTHIERRRLVRAALAQLDTDRQVAWLGAPVEVDQEAQPAPRRAGWRPAGQSGRPSSIDSIDPDRDPWFLDELWTLRGFLVWWPAIAHGCAFLLLVAFLVRVALHGG